MILRRQPPVPCHGTLAAATAAVATVPAWLRRAVPDRQSLAGKGVEDIAMAAGAALGALDAVVRRDAEWAGAWRHRLALSAAAVTARQVGRTEDEGQLRDAVMLTRPGDDVGPAGRLLLAWRRLATQPARKLLTEPDIAGVLEDLGFSHDDEVVCDLVDDLRQISASAGMVEMLTGAFAAAERHGYGRGLGAWLADVLLAERLGWPRTVPLLGSEAASSAGSGRSRRPSAFGAAAGSEAGSDQAKWLLAAQARAALRAIDLSAELGRRAERLLAVAPKLRAKGAEAVVERLLDEDALVASRGEQKTGMSDRGLRRLFDRLIEHGGVRELSGRPAFRIYGL
jgi:hypothetical protein